MKKYLLAAAAVLALALGGFVVHQYSAYPIEPDQSDLMEHLRTERGKEPVVKLEITLYGSVAVGKKTFFLMEWGDSLGDFELERGILGRYKLNHRSSGSGNFRWEILTDGEESYLVAGGRNPEGRIAWIEVKAGGTVYNLDLPEEDHFLVSKELYTDISSIMAIDFGEMRFYDRQGADITEDIEF